MWLCCRIMAVKEWFRRLQPVQLYLILFFTTAFFIVEMVASHVTHSLTLLLNAYHMLCNIIALVGCIASIKVSFTVNYPAYQTIPFDDHQLSTIIKNISYKQQTYPVYEMFFLLSLNWFLIWVCQRQYYPLKFCCDVYQMYQRTRNLLQYWMIMEMIYDICKLWIFIHLWEIWTSKKCTKYM